MLKRGIIPVSCVLKRGIIPFFKCKNYGIIPVFMPLKHEIIPEKVLTVRFFVSLQIFKN